MSTAPSPSPSPSPPPSPSPATLALPPLLRRWQAELALFPPELRLPVGAWLARLDQALGPAQGAERRAGGEPDGLDGLARSGSYERLLLAEWLLADAAPDEFLRRAAAKEHLFLHLARRAPASARRQLVLFDAGPDQLGAARLVHVALLLLLGARAARAGVPFAWGLLQDRRGDAERRPETGLDERAVERLLGARTAAIVEPADLAAWTAGAPVAPGLEDRWLVGGAELAALAAPGAARVIIGEPDEADPAHLDVVVQPAGGAAARVRLARPAAYPMHRFLQQPFDRPAPAVTPAAPGAFAEVAVGTPMICSPDGRRVLTRDRHGRLVALGVPPFPGDRVPRARTLALPAEHVVIALGWQHRRGVAVTQAQGQLWLVESHGGQPRVRALVADDALLAAVRPPAFDVAPSPLVARRTQGSACLLFYDGARALFELRLGAHTLKRLPYRVATLAHVADQALAVATDLDGRARVRQAGVLGPAGLAPLSLDVRGEDLEAFWAQLGDLDQRAQGVVAAHVGGGRWVVHYALGGAQTVHIDAPAGTRVIGLGRLVGGVPPFPTPALVVLDASACGVWLIGPGDRKQRLLTSPAPIVRWAFGTPRGLLALQGADAVLRLWRTLDARFLGEIRLVAPP